MSGTVTITSVDPGKGPSESKYMTSTIEPSHYDRCSVIAPTMTGWVHAEVPITGRYVTSEQVNAAINKVVNERLTKA